MARAAAAIVWFEASAIADISSSDSSGPHLLGRRRPIAVARPRAPAGVSTNTLAPVTPST